MDTTDNSEELKAYLYGSDSILDRLKFARNVFGDSHGLSTDLKEDTVILWLASVLTTKTFELGPEEGQEAWSTLEDILKSQKVEELCSRGWTLLLKSSFLETLVSLATSSELHLSAMRIVSLLLKNSQLAPLVTQRPNHCLALLKCVIESIVNHSRSDEDIAVASILLEEVIAHMRSNVDKKKNFFAIVEYLLLPEGKLHIALKHDERSMAKKLTNELRNLVYENIATEEMCETYDNAFCSLFSEETKMPLSEDANKIFTLLANSIYEEPPELSSHIISEFFRAFALMKKDHHNLNYKMLVVLCFIVGLLVKGSQILSVTENNLACQHLAKNSCIRQDTSTPVVIHEKQEMLLLSLLLVVKEIHLDHEVWLERIAPTEWLESVGKLIIEQGLHSPSGLQCLRVLLEIDPKNIVSLVLDNIFVILSKCSKETEKDKMNEGLADASGSLRSSADELFCDVLQVYSRLQQVPNMFVNILHNLLKMPEVLQNFTIIPETLHVYDGNLLFPPKFMFETIKIFHNLGHTNVIATWKVFLSLLAGDFTKLMEETKMNSKYELVSVAVWLLSSILKAFPVLDMMSVPSVSDSIVDLMNQTAVEVIKPFVTTMLTLPHNNDLCGSLLVLSHTWGELHCNLCTYEKYVKHPRVTPVLLPESNQPITDFSYLIPFISSDMWAQISARVANFGNQSTQLGLVQLVLQKQSIILQHHPCNFDVHSLEETMLPSRRTIEATTKYLLNAIDVWGGAITQLLILHLPYLIHAIHDMHLPILAKHLVAGYKEGSQYWVEYIESDHFLEAERLHSHVLAHICSTLGSSCTSRKRRLSESDSDLPPKKNYVKKLFTKMADTQVTSSERIDHDSEETISNVKVEECGAIFGQVLNNKSKCSESFGSVKDLQVMMRLLKRFPFTYLSQYNKTVILFVLLTTLVNDEYDSEQEKLDLLRIVNVFLGNQKCIHLFNIIDIESLMKWLIRKRLELPISVHPSLGTASSQVFHKLRTGDGSDTEPVETLISLELDFSIRYIIASVKRLEKRDFLSNLASFITTEELQVDKEAQLHVAELLLAACYAKMKLTSNVLSMKDDYDECKGVFNQISSWILHYVKKVDMATIQPATAVSFLNVYTMILSDVKSMAKEIQVADPEGKDDADKKKTPGYLKYLKYSLKLSELCLLGNNPCIMKHVLAFLQKVSECSSLLDSQLPPNFFLNTWTSLSKLEDSLMKTEFSHTYKECIKALIPLASPLEYEVILKDLLRKTQTHINLVETLTLWQVILSSPITGKKNRIRCYAIEHLIPLLMHPITQQYSEISNGDLLLLLAKTVRITLDCHGSLSDPARSFMLKFCSSMPLISLSSTDFHKVFRVLASTVNRILTAFPDFSMQRLVPIVAIVGHFSETLIAHSNQDYGLNDTEIKNLVDCSISLERMVSRLLFHRQELKKMIHTAIARIVVALQRTVIYKEIKVNMEFILYHLLDISSEYSYNHLVVSLDSGSTVLLKHLYSNFRNFYKYHSNLKGKGR